MKKLVIFLLIVVIILIIIVLGLYSTIIQISKGCLDSTLTHAEGMMEVCSRVSELEDKVETLENTINNIDK